MCYYEKGVKCFMKIDAAKLLGIAGTILAVAGTLLSGLSQQKGMEAAVKEEVAKALQAK